jgi:hypothetical protein
VEALAVEGRRITEEVHSQTIQAKAAEEAKG